MMKRLMTFVAAGLVAFGVSASPLAAQTNVDAANRADAQCLAMFLTAFSDENTEMDAEAKMGGTVLIGYYLGKLDARSPGFNLETLLVDVLTNDMATSAQIDAIADRCGKDAMNIADRMIDAGESMGAAGQ